MWPFFIKRFRGDTGRASGAHARYRGFESHWGTFFQNFFWLNFFLKVSLPPHAYFFQKLTPDLISGMKMLSKTAIRNIHRLYPKNPNVIIIFRILTFCPKITFWDFEWFYFYLQIQVEVLKKEEFEHCMHALVNTKASYPLNLINSSQMVINYRHYDIKEH